MELPDERQPQQLEAAVAAIEELKSKRPTSLSDYGTEVYINERSFAVPVA